MLRIFFKDGFQHCAGKQVGHGQCDLDGGSGPFPCRLFFNDGFQGGQFIPWDGDSAGCLAVQSFQLFFTKSAPVTVLLVQAVDKYRGGVGLYHGI